MFLNSIFKKSWFGLQMVLKSLTPPIYSFEKLEALCRKKLQRGPTAYLPRLYLAHLYKDYVKYPEARKQFEVLLQQGRKDPSEIIRPLGEICYRLKDYAGAIEQLETIADRYSHDRYLNGYLGMSYARTGSYQKAVSHLIRAADGPVKKSHPSGLKEGPLPGVDYGLLSETIGYCFFKLQLFENSAEWYLKALSLEPDGPRSAEIRDDTARAHTHLGNTLQKEGKVEEAIAQFRLALEVKPEKSIIQAISRRLNDLEA